MVQFLNVRYSDPHCTKLTNIRGEIKTMVGSCHKKSKICVRLFNLETGNE